MKKLLVGCVRFLKDEEGVTALEYGLLAGLIAVAIVVGAATLGTNINSAFCKIANCITTPGSGCMSTSACA